MASSSCAWHGLALSTHARVRCVLWLFLCPWLLISRIASAQPWVASTLSHDGPLRVELNPLLGAHSPASTGWMAFLVRIENTGGAAFIGRVILQTAGDRRRSLDDGHLLASAKVTVAANDSTWIKLSAHGTDSPEINVTLLDANGRPQGEANTLLGPVDQSHLFDLSVPSRLVPVLAQRVSARRLKPNLDPSEALLASEASQDYSSGLLLLPDRAADYSATTLVLIPAKELEHLPEVEFKALGGWLMSGGSLAVTFAPGPLMTPRVNRLIGGALERAAWSDQLLDPKRAEELTLGVHRPTLEESSDRDHLSEAVLKELGGFRGGNLRPTTWGHVASYGVGEVHVLGFDPNHPELADLPWTYDKLSSLMRHAKQRRRAIALPIGRQNPDDARSYAVRAALNKTQMPAWLLLLALVILSGYAVLAGPLNFKQANKTMRPLLAVRRLVLLSGVTFGLVFVASYVRSTGRPRARHITFVEAGAAMPRASATRFRAFYDDTYAQVRVQATHVESSLAVVNTDHDVRAQTVVVDSTMRLEQLHSKPWKTLLVREEGFFDVGGGISLTQKQGDLVVTNRSNQDLLGAVARGADGRVYFCERIASGEQLALSETHSIHVVGAPPRAVYFPLLLHNFDWRMDDVSPGLSTAWQAIEALRAGEVDWWPPDVPVLIAQLATGEGRALDSGYQIESEYVLIRVLGYGGSS